MLIFACQEDVSLFHFPNQIANNETVTRDVRERGRDIEGCIKQWFSFVKPNFSKYVEPQKQVAGELHLSNRHTYYDDPFRN